MGLPWAQAGRAHLRASRCPGLPDKLLAQGGSVIHTSMKVTLGFLLCFLLALPSLGQAAHGNVDSARTVLKTGLDAKDPDERVQAIQACGLVGLNDALRLQLETL